MLFVFFLLEVKCSYIMHQQLLISGILCIVYFCATLNSAELKNADWILSPDSYFPPPSQSGFCFSAAPSISNLWTRHLCSVTCWSWPLHVHSFSSAAASLCDFHSAQPESQYSLQITVKWPPSKTWQELRMPSPSLSIKRSQCNCPYCCSQLSEM